MAWKQSVGIVLLALAACSPTPKSAAPAPLIQTASASESIGHTPFPARGYRPGDYLFFGYRCGGDCALHQKGYQWAAEHRVSDARKCQGTSEEFLEGCMAFAGIEGPLGERDFDVSFPHMSGID